MIEINRILCPTDLSTESDEALRYAVALARAYDAQLFLLHCSEADQRAEEEGDETQPRVNRLFTESLVPHLGLATMDELNWQGILRHRVRNVGDAIVQEAVKQKIDLIVMRSRRRPRTAVLLGSTAEAVSQNAPCPVLVTHPREREWVSISSGEIDLNRILIAHDFSHDAETAMKFGLSLAQEYQAEVHLMHVLATAGHDEPELAWSSSSTGNAYTFTARKLQETLPSEVYLWCKFINVVRCGKVADEIMDYAREHEIDLICMGASGSERTIDKLLGSNVDRVLRETPCPVLVVGYRTNKFSYAHRPTGAALR